MTVLTLVIVLIWASLVALIIALVHGGTRQPEPEPPLVVPHAWTVAGRPGQLEDADA